MSPEMQEHMLEIRPEVRDFVAAVRDQLQDLSTEERQELTEGLEADLSDQVAEQGLAILGDPVGYASELRVAAGFCADPAPTKQRRSVGEWLSDDLDGMHRRWDNLVSDLPGDPWEFVQTLRPVWWVLRAWVALQLIDLIFGGGSYNYGLSVLPALGPFSWPLLLVVVGVSVQLGRGRLWPGRPRSGPFGRVQLVLLNTLAVLLLPLIVDNLFTATKAESWFGDDAVAGSTAGLDPAAEADGSGLYAEGRAISQVYPYDAAGRPLVGVQLFDQEGRPIELAPQTHCVYDQQGNAVDKGRVHYPWSNGASQVRNVVPLPSVIARPGVPDPDPQALQREVRPSVGQFPMVSVPAVSLPGIVSSVTRTPKGAIAPGVLPDSPVTAIDNGC